MKKYLGLLMACLLILLCGCGQSTKEEDRPVVVEVSDITRLRLIEYLDSNHQTVKTDVYYDDQFIKTVELDNPNETVYTFEFSYDEEGNINSYMVTKDGEETNACSSVTVDGIEVWRECTNSEGTYLSIDSVFEDGKLVKLYDNLESSNPYITEFVYYDDGRLYQTVSGYGEGEDFVVSDYQFYDYDGDLTIIYHHDYTEEDITSQVFYRYVNDDGDITRQIQYDEKENLEMTWEYDYYDNGLMKSRRVCDSDGDVVYASNYDEYGALIYCLYDSLVYQAK